MELLTCCEEVLHDVREDCALGVGRPVVWMARFVVAADFEGFFEVWVGGAEGGDEGWVGELGYFFAAVGDVAAVGFGGCLGC